MTCHHRQVFDVGGTVYDPIRAVGDPKRCRCQVGPRAVVDHCHQTADGEDMRCELCRINCRAVGHINAADVGIEDNCPFCLRNRERAKGTAG